MEEQWKTISDYPNYNVVIPQRRENGTFNLGAKKKNIRIVFSDGITNYYQGIEDVCKNLNIGKSIFLRYKNDIESAKGRILEIEYVDEAPLEYKNTPIAWEKFNAPKKIKIIYNDNKEKTFENCKAADIFLGTRVGSTQNWVKRTKGPTPKMRALGIKKIEYVDEKI